jgi:hypothetical protein
MAQIERKIEFQNGIKTCQFEQRGVPSNHNLVHTLF